MNSFISNTSKYFLDYFLDIKYFPTLTISQASWPIQINNSQVPKPLRALDLDVQASGGFLLGYYNFFSFFSCCSTHTCHTGSALGASGLQEAVILLDDLCVYEHPMSLPCWDTGNMGFVPSLWRVFGCFMES